MGPPVGVLTSVANSPKISPPSIRGMISSPRKFSVSGVLTSFLIGLWNKGFFVETTVLSGVVKGMFTVALAAVIACDSTRTNGFTGLGGLGFPTPIFGPVLVSGSTTTGGSPILMSGFPGLGGCVGFPPLPGSILGFTGAGMIVFGLSSIGPPLPVSRLGFTGAVMITLGLSSIGLPLPVSRLGFIGAVMITLGLSSIGLPLPVSRLGFTGAGPTVFGSSSTPPSSTDGVSKIVINPPLLVISG